MPSSVPAFPLRRTLIGGAAVATFAVITWAWAHLLSQSDPFWDLAWIGNGLVVSVEPYGPFAAAGLEVYDRIIDVDGHAPGPMPRLHEGPEVGDQIRVRYLRDDRTLTTNVALEEMQAVRRFAQGQKLLVALISLLLGSLVGLWRPDQRLAQLFFVLTVAMALAYATNVLRLSTGSGVRLARVLEFWAAGLLFLACLNLSSRIRERAHWAEYATFIVLLATTALVFVLPPLVGRLDLATTFWKFGSQSLFGLMCLYLLASIVVLLGSKGLTALQERQRRIVVGGITLALLPILLFSLLPQTISGRPLLPYVATNPFLAVIPLAFAYALYHGTQSNVDRVVHNTSVNVLFIVLAFGVTAPLLYLLAVLFPAPSWMFAFAGAALVVVLGGSLGRIRLALEHGVDWLIYGGWHRYREIVKKVSSELDVADSLRRPVNLVNLLFELAQTMRLRPAILLKPDPLTGVTSATIQASSAQRLTLELPLDGRLLHHFRRTAYPIWHDQLRTVLPSDELVEPERDLVKRERSWLWVPLVSNGALQSLVALETPGRHKTLLTDEDLDTLATLAGQVALALENNELNASLASRLQQVEQIRDELAEAQRRLTHEREAERRHLARELHDGPLQMMYGIRFQLDTLHEIIEQRFAEDHELQRRCASVRGMLQDVAGTLRGICTDLRPPLLTEFGLEEALRAFAEEVQTRHPEVRMQLHLMPARKRLTETVRLALYRVAQEATNNAIRHGDARTITMHLEYDAEQVLLEIEDDGRGFEVPERWTAFARDGHLGLLGMSERVESIGGTLSIDSRPDFGTRVRAELPPDVLLPPPSDLPAAPATTIS